MVYHHLQPSFSGGEVSPHTAARAEAGSFSAENGPKFYFTRAGGRV